MKQIFALIVVFFIASLAHANNDKIFEEAGYYISCAETYAQNNEVRQYNSFIAYMLKGKYVELNLSFWKNYNGNPYNWEIEEKWDSGTSTKTTPKNISELGFLKARELDRRIQSLANLCNILIDEENESLVWSKSGKLNDAVIKTLKIQPLIKND